MPYFLAICLIAILFCIISICIDHYARHRNFKKEAKFELQMEEKELQSRQKAKEAKEAEQQLIREQNRQRAQELRKAREQQEQEDLQKKLDAAQLSAYPFPAPRLRPHTSSIFDLKLRGTYPKYRYTDVSVTYADEVFRMLPPYTFFSVVYLQESASILYFDIDDKPVLVALLNNQKQIDMVRDWCDKNWTCHAQVSASGESIDLAFWDHE